MKNKFKINKTLLMGLVILAVIVGILFFNKKDSVDNDLTSKDSVNEDLNSKDSVNKDLTSVEIEECWNAGFGLSTWNTEFRLSEMYTDPKKQKGCALVTLANAEPIVITDTKIGDTPLSIIKALAKGDFEGAGSYQSAPLANSLKQCLHENDSNIGTAGCFYDVEESLQRKIRSMVLLQIEQEKRITYKAAKTSDDPDWFAGVDNSLMKMYWEDWYISTTALNSIKAKECEIDGARTFGGSAWYQIMPACYVQKDAEEIIWLLEQRDKTKEYLEYLDEILES